MGRHVPETVNLDPTTGHPDTVRALWKAIRPHQWVKNLLVFTPMVAAHTILSLDALATGVLTFVVFSLCASSVYLLNDISDIQDDRLHPRKRLRPFAAGHLSIKSGVVAAALLLGLAFAIGIAALSWSVIAIAIIYMATTTAYSVALKKQPVTDVFVLAGLYILRIVAGGVATSTPLSSWFLAFALFLFLSLALLKRYVELISTDHWLAGRGYGPLDAPWIQAIGTSAGYAAVVVLALYVSAPDVAALYTRSEPLWLLCPLMLFWMTRLWFRASRRLVDDDPVVETLRDPVSYLVAVAAAVAVLAAI
jgi:4-hydroxybenzoate polyprenyltransferase